MRVFGLSDKGKKRILNEDSFFVHSYSDKKVAFGAVCDGMGGANAGEVASGTAIDIIREKIDALGVPPKKIQWTKIIRDIVAAANNAIFEKSSEDISLLGMGTTFIGFICSENKAVIANVGDSRAYLISEDEIKQISKDHSLVNELVEKGEISAEQANNHPNKNVITRALGVDSTVECDVFEVSVSKGQHILLCSDGLTEDVSEPEIHFEINNGNSVEEKCKSLIDIANSRGGHDNITVVIVEF